MSTFDARLQATHRVLTQVRASIEKNLAGDAEYLLRDDTCIYVVGSGGRGELSTNSDIDMFVARVRRAPSDIDALDIRRAIARALYEHKRLDPSQGGSFLRMHTAQSLCERLGTSQDDAENTLTARMLLLLESQPLLGECAYDKLLSDVLDEYWKDFSSHAADFQPFVLVNDIIRYWRILLLNYVAKLSEKERELAEPAREADRRLRSYKLRFSRCMTCFSALSALLAVTQDGAVTVAQMLHIVRTRPVERLLALRSRSKSTADEVDALLALYDRFLQVTAAPKDSLMKDFSRGEFRLRSSEQGREFGERMFALLQTLGRDGRARELFRHMVV